MKKPLLIGLDFGTTTSRFILFQAEVAFNAVLKKSEFSNLKRKYESEIIFTPYFEGKLNIAELKKIVSEWIADSRVELSDIVGGGTLLTGLASRSANVDEFVAFLKSTFHEMAIISAQDPILESWVSGMGATAELMQKYPEQLFMNFDIGGGTTNVSILKNSKVLFTDCLFIGARQFLPGTYRLSKSKKELSLFEVSEILKSSIKRLEKVYLEKQNDFSEELAITFSGGVGEWVYSPKENSIPTFYGDLGGEFAKKIIDSKILSKNIDKFIPAVTGGATVLGLATYSTELSGNSIYVSESLKLPLHFPVIGTIEEEMSPENISQVLSTLKEKASGSCIQILLKEDPLKLLKTVSDLIPEKMPPVTFLLNKNFAKIFGFLMTRGGIKKYSLCVLDEIPYRKSEFVSVGKNIQGSYPVTLYGGKHELA
jgi:ethanolamine utilization protein EutA